MVNGVACVGHDGNAFGDGLDRAIYRLSYIETENGKLVIAVVD